jgi:hypothetical protein
MRPSLTDPRARIAAAILCLLGASVRAQTVKPTASTMPYQVPSATPAPNQGGGWNGFLTVHSAPAETAPDAQGAWVRGSASLAKATGVVDFCVGMATDSRDLGPKAQVGVSLLDDNNHEIASIAVDEIGRGGRAHRKGDADVQKFCGQATVSPEIAARTTDLGVHVHITGLTTKPIGIDPGGAVERSKIQVTVR